MAAAVPGPRWVSLKVLTKVLDYPAEARDRARAGIGRARERSAPTSVAMTYSKCYEMALARSRRRLDANHRGKQAIQDSSSESA